MNKSHRWVPFAAAAAVVLVAGGAYVLNRPHAPSGDAPFGVAQATPAPAASLVVREGTEVRATGQVVTKPGKPARFCAPAPTPAIYPPPDTCLHGVPVVGVDPNRLSPEGKAQLRGVWRDGRLTVLEQGPPVEDPAVTHGFEPVPCAPPPGGWESPGDAESNELHRYVEEENPDRFRRIWVSNPDGVPKTTMDMASATRVLVVEVVRGDPEEAGAVLRRLYRGNLCVVGAPGRPSLADQNARQARVDEVLHDVMRDPANGVYSSSGGTAVQVGLMMVTPALEERFAQLGDAVVLRPWLRPVS